MAGSFCAVNVFVRPAQFRSQSSRRIKMDNLIWVIATLFVTGIIIVMDDGKWDRKKTK
jgi:hypothetical protein